MTKEAVIAQDLLRETALHRAAHTGRIEIVEELLASDKMTKVAVSVQNKNGKTALDFVRRIHARMSTVSAQNKYAAVVKALQPSEKNLPICNWQNSKYAAIVKDLQFRGLPIGPFIRYLQSDQSAQSANLPKLELELSYH